ncbi:alanine-zipper protein [Robiginitomaculum antarcticum]|uniref:alanine-zipper protein n=1 Tax=Robiginitomaculum antarcticum TaxID=437507 RepID=UPI000362C507|nr:alanine-zipper protein [Robiginitomaculum antarcticum]
MLKNIVITTALLGMMAAPAFADPGKDKKNIKVEAQVEQSMERADDARAKAEQAQMKAEKAKLRSEDAHKAAEIRAEAAEMREEDAKMRGHDKAMDVRDDDAPAWGQGGQTSEVRGEGYSRMKVKEGEVTDRALPSQALNSRRAQSINCPSGTTAQPNGTCLITGDFNF